MKKLLLLFATMVTLNAKSQTSVYHPFPDSSATWNYHSSQFLCSPFGGTIDSYYSIMINGDTLINGQIYHNLWTPFVMNIINGTCTPWIIAGYQGAIREDTAIRKVYYVPPSNNTEQLLYDFNMQVGDTVQGIIESWIPQKDTVESIDSVLIGSSYRKRWNINSCYNIYFIEGIGSTYGLFQLSPHCYFDLDNYSLNCFQQNGMSLYPNTTTNCELITGISDVYPEKYLTTVSPNPFRNELRVETSSNELSEIIFYDITSRKIIQQKFINSVSLNTEQLVKGLYLYEVRNNDGLYKKGKVVKN